MSEKMEEWSREKQSSRSMKYGLRRASSGIGGRQTSRARRTGKKEVERREKEEGNREEKVNGQRRNDGEG